MKQLFQIRTSDKGLSTVGLGDIENDAIQLL